MIIMKKTEIVNAFNRKFGRATLQLKKHSPEILAAAGVIGTVTGFVLACKATTKAGDILEETHEAVEKIHQVEEKAKNDPTIDYTEEDKKKDLAIVYLQTGVKYVKLYAPAVIITGLSIGAMLTSNKILRKRNIALAAAYTAVDKSFKEYRGRVVERFGEKLDRELKYGVRAEEIEETVVDEKGKEKTVKKTVEVVDPNSISDYAKFFDVGNPNWEKDSEFNLMFLKRQQDYANDRLKAKGHLFLNEVYDMLGIDRTKAGQIVGWVYDEDHPVGDNFVDFGIYDYTKPANVRFVNGNERTILLDFNVDGPIYGLI